MNSQQVTISLPGFAPVTVTLTPRPAVRAFIHLPDWTDLALDILDLDAESHVGRRIIALCVAASGLLAHMDEPEDRANVQHAVCAQANVWLFG